MPNKAPDSITLVRQPLGTSLCGQACVAMVAGISLDDSIRIFGHIHSTTTDQVKRALRRAGVPCAERLQKISEKHPKPPRCIVAIRFTNRTCTHWAVYWRGRYYDPACGVVRRYWANTIVSSYLEIYK